MKFKDNVWHIDIDIRVCRIDENNNKVDNEGGSYCLVKNTPSEVKCITKKILKIYEDSRKEDAIKSKIYNKKHHIKVIKIKAYK